MSLFKNLKTSTRISVTFVVINFLSLLLLLVAINIVYFFIWYEDKKQESLYDMNVNYTNLIHSSYIDNTEAFKEYILQKDTIILSENGNLICSPGVSKKLHESVEELEKMRNSLFYKDKESDILYFIFSREYESIGEVRILFDTTKFMEIQVLIIRISLIVIMIFLALGYGISKIFSKFALRDLINIAEQSKNIDIDNFQKIQIEGPKNDEIKILAETINASYEKIGCQTKNLKQFITDVSHEFKTPLMVINSKIDLYHKKIEKNTCSPMDVDILLKTIKLKTAKLNNLLETMFLLSRKAGGIEKFERSEVDLGKYIQGFTDDYISGIEQKVQVIYKLDIGVIKCIDKSTFSIIIENLLTNAVKFSKNPKIELGLDDKGLWIKDNGEGITEGELKKIRDKFYRSDINIEGFGVGLFIVKRMVELYGWKITVESTLGRGTKFSIKF